MQLNSKQSYYTNALYYVTFLVLDESWSPSSPFLVLDDQKARSAVC